MLFLWRKIICKNILYGTKQEVTTTQGKFHLSHLKKATALFSALERDFKYLIGVDENKIHHTLASAEK